MFPDRRMSMADFWRGESRRARAVDAAPPAANAPTGTVADGECIRVPLALMDSATSQGTNSVTQPQVNAAVAGLLRDASQAAGTIRVADAASYLSDAVRGLSDADASMVMRRAVQIAAAHAAEIKGSSPERGAMIGRLGDAWRAR